MTDRKVTEQDFRMPEFIDAKVEDYEFRADGKLVRKNRWEKGIRHISCLVDINHDFEIDEVVSRVRALVDTSKTAHLETLLDKAINAMTELHANIIPPEDENEANASSVLVSALRKFVDVHAELMYERHQLLSAASQEVSDD